MASEELKQKFISAMKDPGVDEEEVKYCIDEIRERLSQREIDLLVACLVTGLDLQ